MVCCNSCQRWQHINGHNLADRNAGRPLRDWKQRQFYCQRCRPNHTRVANGGSHQHPPRPIEQYQWSQPHQQKPVPAIAQHSLYQQPASDMRYQYTGYENGNGSPYRQPYGSSGVSAQSSYQRIAQPPNDLQFQHYQPQQGGFSRSQQAMMSPTASWTGGYPMSNGSPSRAQPPMQVPVQYNQNGMYNGRVAQSYQVSTEFFGKLTALIAS